MCTFDQALYELYNKGYISYEEALRNADSSNELRLNIKLKSERGEPPSAGGPTLSYNKEPSAYEIEKRRQEELRKQEERRRQIEDEQMRKIHKPEPVVKEKHVLALAEPIPTPAA
jgi:twitching motility protein PilU